jgi:hypothetical protein
MRFAWFAAALLFLLTSPSYSQASEQGRPEGRVIGTVLDELDQPINKAQVCTVVNLPGESHSLCVARTDKTGQFQINHLPMGTFGVVASKIDDGYEDFEHAAPEQTVTLTPEQPLASVTVKLGPRAGILIPSVKDVVTGKPVSDFWVSWKFDIPNGSSTGVSGFSRWTTRTSIPADRDLSLEVSAHGYKKWVYADGSSPYQPLSLRLRSAERRVITVDLQPEADKPRAAR